MTQFGLVALGILRLVMTGTATQGSPPAGWLVVPVTAESVAVILDAQSLAIVARVRTLPHPQDAIGSPVTSRALVLEMGSDSFPEHSVLEIDVPSGRVARRIDLGTCRRPHLGRISRDGRSLWIACTPEIVELDLESPAHIVRRWRLAGAGAWNFDVSPDRTTIITANFDDSSATLITPESGARSRVRLSGRPIGVAVSPRGGRAWIGAMGTDSLYLLDLRTGLVAARFASHGSAPARIGYSSQHHQVIITNSESNSISMYDMETMRLTRSVTTPPASPKGLVVSDDGTTAFVSLMDSNEVIRVDIPSGTITGRVVVGSGPERAAWVPRRDH